MPGRNDQNQSIWAFEGDYHPVEVMLADKALFRAKEVSQTALDMPFDHTYNDRVNLLANGRSYQDSKYYREASSASIISVTEHAEAFLRRAQIDTVALQTVTVQGKNLLDKARNTLLNMYVNGSTLKVESATGMKTVFCPVTAGNVYTISKSRLTNRFIVGFTSSLPALNVAVLSVANGIGPSNISGTVTVPANAKYVVVFYWHTSDTGDDINIQIELGSVATTYAPFVPNSPSPDYPAPISGYSALNVHRRGKNLLDDDHWYPLIGYGTLIPNKPAPLSSMTSVKYATIYTHLAIGTYVLSCASVPFYINRFMEGGYGKALYRTLYNASGVTYATITVTKPGLVGIGFERDTSYTVGTDVLIGDGMPSSFGFQLELASKTPYEPYVGTDYPLPLQAPMYGLTGAVDSRDVNGMEVHRTALVSFTGAAGEPWTSVANSVGGIELAYVVQTQTSNNVVAAMSNVANGATRSAVYAQTGDSLSYVCAANGYVRFVTPYKDVASWKAFLAARSTAGDPVKVLYMRDVPTTYSNPSQQIAIVDGLNNVFSDAGTLNIGYEVPEGQNVAGDVVSPLPDYPAGIVSSAGSVRAQDQAGARFADMAIPELRGIPDGAGGWVARDSIEIRKVGGEWHRIKVQRVGREVYTGDATQQWSKNADSEDGEYVSFFRAKSLNGASISRSKLHMCNKAHFAPWTPPTGNYWWNASSSMGMRIHKSFLEPYGYLHTMTDVQKIVCFRALLAAWYAAGYPLIVDYPLATPIETDLGLIDLPSYYPYTRVLISGDYPPDVTATCKVVDNA